MKKQPNPRCAVIARVPADLRKRLDQAAKKARRSRSAELQARLEESLVRFSVLPPVAAEVAK
jgi:predicted transcriptional regulator